jgi:NitT/TauT family transport system substrate-binding protein
MTRTNAALILVVTALLGCEQHGSQRHLNLDKVRIAIHRDPIVFLPLRVAETRGFYKRERIDAELSEVSGGSKAMEALLGGSVDVAVGSVSDVILLASQGHPVRCFYVLYSRPTVALAVAQGLSGKITRVRDLKGHTVGVTSPGSASHQILNQLLAEAGLSPDDVSIVPIGMSASSVAALEHGKVDAAILIASAINGFEGRHPGTRFIVDTRTAAGAKRAFGSDVFPSLALIAQDTWIQNHRDIALRLVRAVRDGVRWMRESSSDEIREAIPENARMSTPDSESNAIRDTQQAISPDGLMPDAAPLAIARLLVSSDTRVKRVDVSSLYTNEFALSK